MEFPWAPCLGPVLANRHRDPELEKTKVRKLLEKDFIKLYGCYVEDTLVLAKPENVNKILSELNSCHENLRFSYIWTTTTSILKQRYVNRKDTNAGQCAAFDSYRALYNRGAGTHFHHCKTPQTSSLIACVASVPVRAGAMCRVRAKILVARELAREQKGKGAGRGWGSEGTSLKKM